MMVENLNGEKQQELIFPQRWRILTTLFSLVIGTIFALEVVLIIIFAPVVIYESYQVLLAWGWIAPFICLIFGPLSGAGLYFMTQMGFKHAVKISSLNVSSVHLVILSSSAFVAAIALVLYAYGSHKTVAWTDVVVLSNGETVEVIRTAKGDVLGASKSQPAGWIPSMYSITIPRNSSVSSEITWRSELRPFLIDRDPVDQKWHLVAEPFYCGHAAEWGASSKLPFIRYVLTSNGWQRIPIGNDLIGRSANLLISPQFIEEDDVVTAPNIKARNEQGDPTYFPRVRYKTNC
jgi:hypothetical protein